MYLLTKSSSAPSPATVRMFVMDSATTWLLFSSLARFPSTWPFTSLKWLVPNAKLNGNTGIRRIVSSQLAKKLIIAVATIQDTVLSRISSLVPVICAWTYVTKLIDLQLECSLLLLFLMHLKLVWRWGHQLSCSSDQTIPPPAWA